MAMLVSAMRVAESGTFWLGVITYGECEACVGRTMIDSQVLKI